MIVVTMLCAATAGAATLAVAGPRNGDRQRPVRAAALVGTPDPPSPETVASISPADGTTGVAPDTAIVVGFSTPLRSAEPVPTVSPEVPGTWLVRNSTTLVFTPAASFVPSTTYTVTVPGGPAGVVARDGQVLTPSVSASFTVGTGSVLRLQQLLATLGYLPLQFTGTVPRPRDMAMPQRGTFTWRSDSLPVELTGLWSPTAPNPLTTGALMSFETQNGLNVDGVASASVWSALLTDATTGEHDGEPVTYVLVTKTLPQHLTVWVNGVLTFANVPCNTGVAGAPTTDGTFTVFSHVQVSNMRGTDVTGTSYDVTVPWASYFNSGEALHGYPRASYGYPQSNGCVEMPISTAGAVWPDTPIGTLVTVQGPTA